ncbi:uncharacterized protein Enoph isoform X2 [Dermacentor andersoni]|uniref:uncharacterized protein Enoph isoform X2 n=1 Tax=Dermacentor andersoni TaxID=34620 RepID=UPI002417ED54|nr:uncharacterized protein LOC126535682 isoform X2 [Dermacentor andersoni]
MDKSSGEFTGEEFCTVASFGRCPLPVGQPWSNIEDDYCLYKQLIFSSPSRRETGTAMTASLTNFLFFVQVLIGQFSWQCPIDTQLAGIKEPASPDIDSWCRSWCCEGIDKSSGELTGEEFCTVASFGRCPLPVGQPWSNIEDDYCLYKQLIFSSPSRRETGAVMTASLTNFLFFVQVLIGQFSWQCPIDTQLAGIKESASPDIDSLCRSWRCEGIDKSSGEFTGEEFCTVASFGRCPLPVGQPWSNIEDDYCLYKQLIFSSPSRRETGAAMTASLTNFLFFVQAKQDADRKASAPPVGEPAEMSKESLIAQLEANVLWQMDADRKAAPLKALQGLVWKEGYATGQLRAPLYPDVVPTLSTWKCRQGVTLAIYSSGSVQAQRLLFSHTTEGDVTTLLDGYFDISTAGVKTDAKSYEVISQAIRVDPSKILFLTDIFAGRFSPSLKTFKIKMPTQRGPGCVPSWVSSAACGASRQQAAE